MDKKFIVKPKKKLIKNLFISVILKKLRDKLPLIFSRMKMKQQ